MGISGTISDKTASKTTTSSTSTGSVSNSDAAKAYKAVSTVRNLAVGQTVQGEVLSVKGSEIELLLANDVQIQAKLEKSLSVSVGQTINFEVKSNGKVTVLRPLFENMAQDMNLLKALEEANMAPTNRNMQMVQSLMQQQMPVNKQMLTLLNRELAQFQGTLPDTIVSLHKMEIPVMAASIEQFEAYQGTNHYISSTYQEISLAIQEGMLQLFGNEDFETTLLVLEKLVALGLEQTDKGDSIANSVEEGIKDKIGARVNEDGVTDSTAEKGNESANLKEIASIMQIESREDNLGSLPKMVEKNAENAQEGKVGLGDSTEKNIGLNLSEDSLNAENLLRKMGEVLQKFSDTRLLKTPEEIKEFIESKTFENVIRNAIEKNGLITPGDVDQKEAMNSLYKMIQEQTRGMLALAQAMGKSGEELTKTVVTLRDNVEFMNMINQTFSYIQIPVKMAYPNAKAELFVYAHKKNESDKGDTTSALLHLDMAHVGMLDIHVLMNGEKVTTQFILEKEELLDLFAENLPALDKRLMKRGYVATSTIQCRKEKINTMDRIRQEKKEAGDILLINQSFDARA